jgi:small subunit ribosomal protein S6
MRTYELMYIVDPRVSDDDLGAVSDAVKNLVGSGGASVIREEIWGRRKLAYPIDKQTEGKYVLLYLTAEDAFDGAAEVEKRMEQNDLILRYMTVRTDEDLKRAHGTVTEEIAAGRTGDENDESGDDEEAADGEE